MVCELRPSVRPRSIGLRLSFEKGHESRRAFFELFAVDDKVKEAVFEQEFAALKAFGEVFLYRFFDDPGTRKADEGAGLGDIEATQHSEGCRDAAERWVGQ